MSKNTKIIYNICGMSKLFFDYIINPYNIYYFFGPCWVKTRKYLTKTTLTTNWLL